MHYTLLSLGYPLQEVHRYAEAVRRDHYNLETTTEEEHRSLHDLLQALKGVEVVWMELSEGSALTGKSLAQADIRSRSGASVVALVRNGELIANPKSMTVFEPGDRIGVIGEMEQLEQVQKMVGAAVRSVEDPKGF